MGAVLLSRIGYALQKHMLVLGKGRPSHGANFLADERCQEHMVVAKG